MTLPLYREAIEQQPARATDGHAGLWFDKFCDQWRVEQSRWTLKSGKGYDRSNPKLDWINTLTSAAVGARRQIEESALRLMRLVESHAGRWDVFATESRFVTGLGRSHPVENGFAWHPTLGTPYLPGSSVKGLVRDWARAEGAEKEELQRLLGDPGKAGSICLLDAVPTKPVQLEADVMTPHYAGWTAEDPPGDWRSPTPIPFLASAVGSPFLFGIVPCGPLAAGDMEVGATWLREALAWAGAGAKTAVGYGRFRRDEAETAGWTERLRLEDQRRRDERERQEAMRSPEGRWRLELRGLSEDAILDMVRIHLEKRPVEDARERAAFARAVVSTGLVEGWRRGAKHDPQTSIGKKKLRERVRLLDSALQERAPASGR